MPISKESKARPWAEGRGGSGTHWCRELRRPRGLLGGDSAVDDQLAAGHEGSDPSEARYRAPYAMSGSPFFPEALNRPYDDYSSTYALLLASSDK